MLSEFNLLHRPLASAVALCGCHAIGISCRLQVMRLYVVPGVPEDTAFETRTKKEIGEIAWHKIKELPTSKDVQGKAKPFWCAHGGAWHAVHSFCEGSRTLASFSVTPTPLRLVTFALEAILPCGTVCRGRGAFGAFVCVSSTPLLLVGWLARSSRGWSSGSRDRRDRRSRRRKPTKSRRKDRHPWHRLQLRPRRQRGRGRGSSGGTRIRRWQREAPHTVLASRSCSR